MVIYTDRSRIADNEKCPRLRFWRYHYDGVGLEPSGEAGLKLDARIGTWTHWGIEQWLGSDFRGDRDHTGSIAVTAEVMLQNECRSIVEWDGLNVEQQFQITEAGRIVKALVYAWCRTRGPSLLAEGDVLAIEQEIDVDFPIGGDVVRLMARSDIIYRRKLDGETFIRNMKTVRDPGTRWREQWALDMQTLSEPLAVDKWLGRDRCSGVTIDGLITGAVLEYPRGSGHYYHNTPLLYAWCRKGQDDAPFGIQDEWYARYEWTCTGPHKMGNGRKCEGGHTHKLSGVTKESIDERYPGGTIAWIDWLLENDRAIIEEQLIELPPILRSEWHIERWKSQTIRQEQTVKITAEAVNDCLDKDRDALLDAYFPMHTSSGNCLFPGKCMAYDLCWGSAATAPLQAGYVHRILQAGYVHRIPNHPQEGGDNNATTGTSTRSSSTPGESLGYEENGAVVPPDS